LSYRAPHHSMQNDEIYPSQKFQRYPKYWGECQQDILVKLTILLLFIGGRVTFSRRYPTYVTPFDAE
ncbi:unnamed protein product, partial [Adineta ricciae]